MTFLARDHEIRTVPLPEARGFIAAHHYSKGSANTAVYRHGLFRKSSPELLGVVLWMPCLKVVGQSVNPEAPHRVLNLSRMAIHPKVETNAASFLMAASIKRIRLDQKWVALVTYADEYMGHTGGVYLAANWGFVGEMPANPRWEDELGKQVATRTGNPGRTRTKKEMQDLGYTLVGSFKKRKYTMQLHQRRKPKGNPFL